MFPITTTAQIRELEQKAVQAGVSQAFMMDRAGHALGDHLLAHALRCGYARGPVLILAGPGSNGGDGIVCARRLSETGERIYLYLWRRSLTPGDTLLDALAEQDIDIARAEDDPGYFRLRRWLRLSSWCVDALLGTGANRAVEGQLAEILTVVKENLTDRHHICAADCPSGIDCDTGAVSPQSLRADITVMFGAAKQGLYLEPALEHCGTMAVADIGIPDALMQAIRQQGLDETDLRNLVPQRRNWSHKGSYGKALCVVGSHRYPGAAYLSAYAAVKSGSGLVTAAVPDVIQQGLIPAMPEVTYLPLVHEDGAMASGSLAQLQMAWADYTAILLGCGLSHTGQTRNFVHEFLHAWQATQALAEIPLVLDADALNCLAQIPDWPDLLPARTILTPHMAEMGRLCGQPTEAVMANGAELALTYAQTWNSVVLLKGPHSWIGTPEGNLYAIMAANSALAKAGTGDVLSGLIVGMLAQGQSPTEAACGAALVHSLAGRHCADAIGAAGTVASDVLQQVPAVLQQAGVAA